MTAEPLPLWLRPGPVPGELDTLTSAAYGRCLSCEVTWRGELPCWSCGGASDSEEVRPPIWWSLAAVAFHNQQGPR